MNLGARNVDQSTVEHVAQLVPPEDLFVTQSIEQTDRCVKDILLRGYPLVFCGGGDGTAMRIIEQLFHQRDELQTAGTPCRMPNIGLLKLGTGNAWAGLLRVPRRAKPIEFLRQGRTPTFTRFWMVESEGRLAHIGGIGMDAAILNDYVSLKNRVKPGLLWRAFNSLFGYVFTILFKSIPRIATAGARFRVRVMNDSDAPVYLISHSMGQTRMPFRKGDEIFRGEAVMVGFGTTPHYGFDFKAFPHACARPGYMNLRIASTSIPRILSRVAPIWNGTYEDPTLWDYLVTRVRIESDTPLPFQLGGDVEGCRETLTIQVADRTIDVMDFR